MPALVDDRFPQFPFLREPPTVNMIERPDHSEGETLQLLPPAALMNELTESVMTHNLIIHLKTGKSTTTLAKKKSFPLTFTCINTNKL